MEYPAAGLDVRRKSGHINWFGMLGDAGYVGSQTAKWERFVPPVHWEIMIQEVVCFMHFLLGFLENIPLFVD